MKNLLFTILFAAALPASAGEELGVDARLIGGGYFSDPSFQDMVETSDGYLNSKNTALLRSDYGDFRDAPISAAPISLKTPPPPAKAPAARVSPEDRPGLPALPQSHYKVTFAGDSGPVGSFVWPMDSGSKKYAREYVLLGVTIKGNSYDKLLPKLEAAGLRFAGEKTSYNGKAKQTVILGWAPYSALPVISRVGGVTGVSVEKKSAGVPMKARVRFTLKVPYQNKPNAFVPGFIKQLTENGGFSAENWFRLPQKNPDSRFSVFEVAGTLPVDMIGDLSRSPFVSSVEFSDASL